MDQQCNTISVMVEVDFTSCSINASFYRLLCVWACARRHKIKMFVHLYQGLNGYLSLPSIQTPTIYSGFSDFPHSVGSGFPLTIHADR